MGSELPGISTGLCFEMYEAALPDSCVIGYMADNGLISPYKLREHGIISPWNGMISYAPMESEYMIHTTSDKDMNRKIRLVRKKTNNEMYTLYGSSVITKFIQRLHIEPTIAYKPRFVFIANSIHPKYVDRII